MVQILMNVINVTNHYILIMVLVNQHVREKDSIQVIKKENVNLVIRLVHNVCVKQLTVAQFVNLQIFHIKEPVSTHVQVNIMEKWTPCHANHVIVTVHNVQEILPICVLYVQQIDTYIKVNAQKHVQMELLQTMIILAKHAIIHARLAVVQNNQIAKLVMLHISIMQMEKHVSNTGSFI